MTKKMIFRLCLIITTVLSLYSCQQELLQTEQDYALQSQKSTIQQLVRAQLEKKDPQLLSKIEKLSAKKYSANGKIYTDAENGFSIDTDKAIFVEDANGNKTYTFKIERNMGSSDFLENLVLKQIGNSEYMAYISKYDRLAVEDLGSIAPSDLKNHITFTPLGTKTGAEIFGKQQYEDPASCLILLPGNLSYIYVAGALCYTAEHDYTHIYNCNYLATGQQGPTAGYYTWEISYDTVNMCTGLPQGSTTGGSTIPIHGGGGSSENFVDPCDRIKQQIKKYIGLKTKLQDLSATTSQSIENGFFIDNTATATTANPVQPIPAGSVAQLNINPTPAHPYQIVAHTHNSPSGSTYSVPSLSDMISISDLGTNGHTAQNFTFYTITADGTQYALIINDPATLTDFFYKPKDIGSTDFVKANNMWNVIRNYYGDEDMPAKIKEDNLNNVQGLEKDLKYFLEFLQEAGLDISVLEADNTFSSFKSISLDSNGNVNKQNCN